MTNLIASLITIASSAYFLIRYFIKNYSIFVTSSIWIKIIIIIFILLIVRLIIKNLKELWETKLFKDNAKALEKQILKQKNNEESAIVNFDKIIPSTKTIELLYKTTLDQAKAWSKDACLYSCDFSIRKYNGTAMITNDFTYFSQNKRMTLSFNITNLKKPKKKLSLNQLRHQAEGNCKKNPYFKNKKWRKVVIECLMYMESELIGHNFSCNMFDIYQSINIHLDIRSIIPKSVFFKFDYNTLELTEGIHTKNLVRKLD